MTMTMTKGRNGWKAVTTIELNDDRVLTFDTSKGFNPGVYTTASVAKRDGAFMVTEMFGDFHHTVFREGSVKCTEKNVRMQHEMALEKRDDVIALMTAFYAKKNITVTPLTMAE